MRVTRSTHALSMVVALTAAIAGNGCNGCDDIGCLDQVVHIDAGELPTSLLPFDITACVDGTCHQVAYVVTDQNSPMVPVDVDVPTIEVDEGDVLSVTLVVSSQLNREVLLETSGEAKAVRYRAAGDCGPWCTNATLTLDPQSGLLVGPRTAQD